MKVLQIHNTYQQPGGEDIVARAEAEVLRQNGVEVIEVSAANGAMSSLLKAGIAKLPQQAYAFMFSGESYDMVRGICEKMRPDVAHVHNFWMKLSPAVHSACHDAGVPTIQSLHNFRLLCTNGLLLRNGHVCEDCLGRQPWRGITRRCYRHSFVASAAVAGMITYNRQRSTWNCDVDLFIALTEFSRRKFIEGGLPAAKIQVKPNFVEDVRHPGPSPSSSETVLYVGRLSPEKGVGVLLQAWADTNASWLGQLVIVGDGPERQRLETYASKLGLLSNRLIFAGSKTHDEVLRLMSESRAVIIPSLWYENFPMTLVETLMCGRPVLASDLGSLRELVPEQVGLRFVPGDASDLGRALETILIDGTLADRLGSNARAAYLQNYTPQGNYQRLISLYHDAIERRGVSYSQIGTA